MADRHSDGTGYTRREFGKLALAGVPASMLLANMPLSARAMINSRIKGVQIGAITYSFRSIPDPNVIIADYVKIGLGEMEVMSTDVEKLAGAPKAPPPPPRPARAATPPAPAAAATPTDGAPGANGRQAAPGGRRGGRPPMTPEQIEAQATYQAALQKFRMSATEATFKPVRDKIQGAGIELRLLTYNMNNDPKNSQYTKDDDIEYTFTMAKGLGVRAITTSTQVSMAKRVAPFAEKHKMVVGFHGHSMTDRPDEVSTEETFKAVMDAGKYLGCNLDIGHYTAANGDPLTFIPKYHDRITNLHLKDRKHDQVQDGKIVQGANLPWGEGDTKIKEVLLLMSQKKYDFPCNIEYEYSETADAVVEVQKCFDFCKRALA